MNAILSMIGRVIGVIATLVLAVGIGVMVNLERLIMVDEPVEKAAYAVALDGDNNRVILAADMVKRGLAEKVLLSNGEPAREDDLTLLMREIGYAPPDRMEVKYRMLEKLGVPRDKIAEFGIASLNTREEAKALAGFLNDKRDAVIIVTTNYHSKRAKMIFEAALPDVKVMIACPGGCVAPSQWWKDTAVTAQFVLEAVKFGYYLIGTQDRTPI
jgi:uncharacterized SAM-binding protein YcdF (DUF218 family)